MSLRILLTPALLAVFQIAPCLAQNTLPEQSNPPTTSASTNWGPWPTNGWTRATPWSQGMDPRGIHEAFKYGAEKESDALIVIRNGYLVAEWYSREWTHNTRRRTHSLAKSVTSALVGMMIEEGAIGSVNDSAAIYIPEWRQAKHRRITVRNLLSMNSGLRTGWDIDYWLLRATDQNQYTIGIDTEYPPGDVWIYQQCGVQALSLIMYKATGRQPEEYAREKLWNVIGVSDATWWARDDVGNTLTYTSVFATAPEWAKFGYLFLRNGEWDGQQVIPERWVRESTRPSQFNNENYGYLWWLNTNGEVWKDVPADAYQAEGASENHVYVVPSLNLVVVRLGETVGFAWKDNVFLGTICQAVVR